MGGVVYQMGNLVPDTVQDIEGLRKWTSRLMRANEVNPDPNTAMVVCSSALLGLVARARTGQGQRILMDMFGANAYANHDDFLDYDGKPERLPMDSGLHGLSATYRLYPCANDQWVFLAIPEPSEQQAFVDALATLSIDAQLDTIARNDDSTANHLQSVFATRTADFWEAELAPLGIGCVRADRSEAVEFWQTDEQVAAQGLTQEVTHPEWGVYKRHGANVTFDGKQPTLKPPPLAGQHADEILGELGYSPDQISDHLTTGVVWKE